MALPKIVYDAGAGAVTLQCVRGPAGFGCWAKARVHDNVATSGLRERVFEETDLFISFTMPALRVGEDYGAWAAFAAWAMQGGQFEFYPDGAQAEKHHCVDEGDGWETTRVGPGVYSAAFSWRIVPDALAPADAGEVMERFYGVGE